MNSRFTYSTRTGNKVRSYVKVAFVIFVVIAALAVVAAVNRNQMVSEVMATPRPLDSSLIPTLTPEVVASVTPVEDCRSSPADWAFRDNAAVPGSNLKLIDTPCVYEKLEKTVAWVYATSSLGYTRSAAADALGLSKDALISYSPTGQITVLTDYKDEPQQVEVVMAMDNSNLAEWRVNADGQTAVEMTFSGCFQTSEISGGEATSWGDGYPVVCQSYVDYRYQYIVSSINGHVFTIESAKNVRRPMWFGYIGNGNWTWLGNGKVWDVDLSQLSWLQAPTLTTTVMAEKYGFTALPLPQDWQSAVSQELKDAFIAELDSTK